MMKKLSFLFMVVVVAITGCKPKPVTDNTNPAQHVDWSRQAVIYEVNIRHLRRSCRGCKRWGPTSCG